MNDELNWRDNKDKSRYVAYFDIMGFKDIIDRLTHTQVGEYLFHLKEVLEALANEEFVKSLNKELNPTQTKSITFSDSIFIFSHGTEIEDADKIIMDSYGLIYQSLKAGIALKGSIAHGVIHVDLEKQLFYGRPIVDAYLLQQDLMMYTAIIHHTAESEMSIRASPQIFNSLSMNYQVPIRDAGNIWHRIVRPYSDVARQNDLMSLANLYTQASGKPRRYIDNTMNFLKSIEYGP